MVIYTVLAKKIEKIKKKSKKSKKLKKIKNARNNFWGPCQVLNIYPITLNGYIYSPGKKNRKNQKKIEKIKKIEKNKKCSEQFLGPLPGP